MLTAAEIAAGVDAQRDQTEIPVPLARRRRLPVFPVDALPAWLADHTAALAHATQTPIDMAGVLSLGVLAACAGGRAVVEVRPGDGLMHRRLAVPGWDSDHTVEVHGLPPARPYLDHSATSGTSSEHAEG